MVWKWGQQKNTQVLALDFQKKSTFIQSQGLGLFRCKEETILSIACRIGTEIDTTKLLWKSNIVEGFIHDSLPFQPCQPSQNWELLVKLSLSETITKTHSWGGLQRINPPVPHPNLLLFLLLTFELWVKPKAKICLGKSVCPYLQKFLTWQSQLHCHIALAT